MQVRRPVELATVTSVPDLIDSSRSIGLVYYTSRTRAATPAPRVGIKLLLLSRPASAYNLTYDAAHDVKRSKRATTLARRRGKETAGAKVKMFKVVFLAC